MLILSSVPVLALVLGGCATKHANPAAAKPNTGYVDIYTNPRETLSWRISTFDASRNRFKDNFFQMDPCKDRVLRLGFAPGHYRLKVAILNKVTREPAVIETEVKNGEVTPVRVTLTEAGEANVQDKDIRMGAKIKGRRGIKVGNDECIEYEVLARPEEPLAFRAWERMPYAQ